MIVGKLATDLRKAQYEDSAQIHIVTCPEKPISNYF